MASRRGNIFLLSAPAGTGKTTLVKRLTSELPYVVQSISYTSRPKRPHEIDGVDYRFITKEQFQEKERSGDFLEHAKVYDDFYGTDRASVERLVQNGSDVFLVIDTQGAQQVLEKLNAISIFVYPPSLEELKRRLMNRNTETPDKIEERLSWSEKEMVKGKNYHYHIVNDDLDDAYHELRQIVVDNYDTKETQRGI